MAVLLLHRAVEPAPQPVPSRSTRAAEVVEEKRLDERRMELTIRSRALAGTTKVRLLLPAG
ncbi:hypothetical protein AB0F17_40025 [Nonomuraea sp. NPDC026600]|uniref:hypothetical protein n=1 Tax=Nonomuraea sp. NPDC026600 TaxID=3155363 RepID=UPI0033DD0155